MGSSQNARERIYLSIKIKSLEDVEEFISECVGLFGTDPFGGESHEESFKAGRNIAINCLLIYNSIFSVMDSVTMRNEEVMDWDRERFIAWVVMRKLQC